MRDVLLWSLSCDVPFTVFFVYGRTQKYRVGVVLISGVKCECPEHRVKATLFIGKVKFKGGNQRRALILFLSQVSLWFQGGREGGCPLNVALHLGERLFSVNVPRGLQNVCNGNVKATAL
jgi:hypothetical protein